MRPGLLFVLSEPATVPVAQFHDWYDHEHVPGRTAFDQVRNATRWAATDGRLPSWLATYDIDLGVLDRPDYRALREHRSDREREVIAGLATFERRTYELLEGWSSEGTLDDPPSDLVVATSLEVGEDAAAELSRWYAEEHVPLLHAIPGWRRTRRYRLIDGAAPTYLALHDLDDPSALETDAYRRATSTVWRGRVMAQVTGRERRVFGVHARF